MKLIDMHVHTNASDGVFSPEEVIQRGINNGLSGIAIADHDTVKGAIAVDQLQIPRNFTVIKAVEFSTIQNDQEIHILGYNLDVYNKELQKLLEKIQNFRRDRVYHILEKLRKLKLEIEYQEVQGDHPPNAIGRPHVAKVLVKRGIVKDISEAFDRYLAKGRPAYVERYKLGTEEAIDLIKNLGGFSVVAHPGLLSEQELYSVLEKGVEGIEVFHPKHSPTMINFLYNLAETEKKVITGGSDFHDFSLEKQIDVGAYHVLIDPFL